MNTKALSKHYAGLLAAERLSLLTADAASGHLVRPHADARRFRATEQLYPAVCEAAAPGGLTLDAAAREAEAVGVSDADARGYVARGGPDAPRELKTAESIAAELRAAFAYLLGRWA